MGELKAELWEAINIYTEICGGDTSNKTISKDRMDAVVKIERTIEKIREVERK